MIELQYNLPYKTRGNTSPQGKQRIWFCCHPLDFSLFFEDISGELLHHHNCAIWYDHQQTAHEDILRQYIQLARLFVVPVTRRFLSQPSRARDIELPLAIHYHIPILPLIQEPNLDELFSRYFGDRHFLNRVDYDPTAIRYEDKLARFLSQVLVEDETIDHIRCAFDARIFLSYRKKDRAYARKLMETIHSIPFCRDVAIWYDEFLIPGEHFNHSIAKSIQDSNLFLMVVTPNLINESNYIMTDEYPLARSFSPPKPILPVEMRPTNLSTLTRSYPGIPPCVSGEDTAALSQILQLHFQHCHIFPGQKEKDGEHLLLMGLAYLGGIDVEENFHRALTLLNLAADQGVIEAMQRLASIYRYGQGVPRHPQTALKWQERIAAHLQDLFDKTAEERHAIHFLCALDELAELYFEEKNFTRSQEICRRALTLCDHLMQSFYSQEMERYRANFYDLMGELVCAAGHPEESPEYFREALSIRQKISLNWIDKEDDPPSHSGKDETRSQISREINSFIENMRLEIGNDTVSPVCREEVAESYCHLGTLAADSGNILQAWDYFHLAYVILSEVINDWNRLSAKRSLASVCASLGSVMWAQGDLKQAAACYIEAVELAEAVVQEDDSPVSQTVLTQCYASAGYFAKEVMTE